ncbi:c-type cytochrome domain-containing protein [Larkinella soli]|uniref:c-type cytochrome domain-containing protein n=1 Tax=Larkinella soli TaxID=1770527 RepID=UPI000FFB1BB1|nr:c-type cytochrome domain-containing protein [Larkinella soli]
MNRRIIGFAEQVLFALNFFVLFLLLFESKVEVPVWLQSFGRMHPLFLHFPIVFLLLAMGMEFFRFKTANSTNEFYGIFLNNLLLLGALTAGLTVVMGLFLSHEEGYTGTVLQWHKWSGIGIFFVASLIFWGRNQTWYRAPVARAGALVSVLLLIGAGHYGATLTHGENFLFEPITSRSAKEAVPLEQAVVFDHVIKPILEQKCVSCHNPEKLKGELALTDPASILKGGKSGRLFIAGLPDSSLLMKRIHLPPAEKKHMPPLGKTQLTDEEVTLLALWVKGRADFKKKLVDLPPQDSLRRIASVHFVPAEPTEPEYEFAAADEETVQKLTNDYRTILPLAKESPALAVNLYNKATYSPDKLQELDDIRRQIVSLNLSKLPVRDADLRNVAKFENLEKLNLNFTEITGGGLKELTSLEKLESLSLSGTKIRYQDLQPLLGSFKNLETVSLWNTGISDADIGRLRKQFKEVAFISGFRGEDSEPIRLNPPQVKNASTIFTETLQLQLKHPIRGVQIRYTTDGTEPDSLKSPVFTAGTVLDKSTSIRAKAFKDGWFGSSEAVFDFFKSTHKPDSVTVLLPLNRVHQADGPYTFFDRKLGTFNANSPAWANNWAGVRNNDLALLSEFRKPVSVASVALRVMVEPETGIFPPQLVEIWGGSTRENLKLLGTVKPAMPKEKSAPVLKAVECRIKPQPVSFMKIVARPVEKLPDWHPGKGKRALLLVDEVFIN